MTAYSVADTDLTIISILYIDLPKNSLIPHPGYVDTLASGWSEHLDPAHQKRKGLLFSYAYYITTPLAA